jgi:two-component system chemotaxis sensor kinase CheA
MAIDLSQFAATYFEESREGLDVMEAGLLKLDQGQGDKETINTIFRSAHSMKGGAGIFNLKAIAELTHLLETLLDQMRSDKRVGGRAEIDALLASVDVLRGLLAAAQSQGPVDEAKLADICATLNHLLGTGDAHATAVIQAPSQQKMASGWNVCFKPHAHLFMTGNDPQRIMRELARLGDCEVECDLSKLPKFDELDVTQSYLAWKATVLGDVPKAVLDDLFSWVEGDCDLSIESLSSAAAPAKTDEAKSEKPADDHKQGAASSGTVTPIRSPEKKTEAEQKQAAAAPETSIRVAISKLDSLINLVGELVITQAMLKQQSEGLDPLLNEKLLNGLTQLERNTRDIQEAIMGVRMMPVDFVFSRFPRMVRDLAAKLGKQVRLKTIGEGTELDKGVIEKISDPLVHLIRNAVDHGLEMPADRKAAGKDETGTVTISAAHQGGNIVIEVADDGRGLDRDRIVAKAREQGHNVPENISDADAYALILLPGLSTAKELTDVSGRGVGMDVVKKNIVALGGSVDISSQRGKGSKLTVKLPLTLAILDGMSVAVGEEIFILPLNFVTESLQVRQEDIKTVSGQGRLLRVRADYVPLLSLGDMFGAKRSMHVDHEPIVVIVESDGRHIALEVDELVGQQQVVIKSLEANYRRVHGISGATILGDGRVALILDVSGIVRGLSQAA